MPDDQHKVTERTQLSAPQDVVDTIWKNFTSHKPGFISSLLRPSEEADSRNPSREADADAGSYGAARRACIDEVTSIVRECSQRNQMFTDPEFDILDDFENKGNTRKWKCLFSLHYPSGRGTIQYRPDGLASCAMSSQLHSTSPAEASSLDASCDGACSSGSRDTFRSTPDAVRRIHDIFDSPTFAPQATRKHLPSLDLSTFSKSVTTFGLLIAACIAMKEFGNRWTGPNFASCHIKQGSIGDCWWMSAIAALCSRSDLMRKLCVAWDQDCGVYGFVFYRDGAWIHTVVDDRLYLSDDDDSSPEDAKFSDDRCSNKATLQRGSDALHFAKCAKSDYTWLPLLQKAFAKVHGDYQALIRGEISEGLEDITGGIGEILDTDDTKDQERLWHELSRMDRECLYALAMPPKRRKDSRLGLMFEHAYAVEKACSFLHLDGWKLKRVRLLKIRNPWGLKKGVWQGDWGAGSRRWGPVSMWWLQPQGNEDGVFYMTFEAALKMFAALQRTSVFDDSIWTIQQEWVSMNVHWNPQFNAVYFELHLTEDSKTAFSISQLDKRYFATLQGRYAFHLEFAIKKKGTQENKFIVKCKAPKLNEKYPQRSTSITTDLKSGVYEILVKVTAVELESSDGAQWIAEDVLKQSKRCHVKLQQTARNYDQAYGKLKTIEPKSVNPEQPKKSEQPENSENSEPEEPEKPEKAEKKEKSEKPEKPEQPKKSDKSEKPSSEGADSDQFVYPDPGMVAWNAVCGIGLRVFSKDPAMRLEVHHRDEDKSSETKEPAKTESATKKDEEKKNEEKTNETWKVTIEGVAKWEKEKASGASQQASSEDRVEESTQRDDKDNKQQSPQD
ncbi:hypothetical protein M409DRAFT_63860 [Zasmidium cellare ATCC 36951]|uniref:Calpain catalytic domain-containing protein n=1 Tax=Zasmidium cellare ATCC 36951 TaxID=1080233 RepID=A0A6A6CY48_ZASCE|nr:uncharacterized protein M409DRAFT_63860 [Zasmidium cellare ATCC 36951]KAF2170802.1 hypothetical protein M409DRAFT_63860 [Zasmidium cellare ATCC 36951]